ncbi:hypothetical protein EGW08_017306 [Elysia chlorotica]|uniref:Uncharacterized protein n=1 Tax=Elysia chlorotica TaxID=188477 RepID=A0A433T050_ELYCH|nr:hypothetical protein EGW08_017306 [Elysia chlorotica]
MPFWKKKKKSDKTKNDDGKDKDSVDAAPNAKENGVTLTADPKEEQEKNADTKTAVEAPGDSHDDKPEDKPEQTETVKEIVEPAENGMPFWKKKKKSDKTKNDDGKDKDSVDAVPNAKENGVTLTADPKEEQENNAETETAVEAPGDSYDDKPEDKPEQTEIVKEIVEPAENGKIPEPEDNVEKVEISTAIENQEVTFVKEVDVDGEQDGEEPVTSQPAVKSEKSPLISKEDGARGPAVPGAADINVDKGAKSGGFLCCSIF